MKRKPTYNPKSCFRSSFILQTENGRRLKTRAVPMKTLYNRKRNKGMNFDF